MWVAVSDDVPGLVAEASEIEALVDKLRVLVPELLEANGVLPEHGNEQAISLELRTHHQFSA